MAFSSLNPAIEMRVRQPDQPSPRLQRIVSFEESEMPTLRTTAGVSPERAVEELGQEVESLTAHDVSLRKLEVQALVAEVEAPASVFGMLPFLGLRGSWVRRTHRVQMLVLVPGSC